MLATGHSISGQERSTELSVGYFAPYGLQFGGKIGASFNYKQWKLNAEDGAAPIHKLNINPQLGYFVNPDVQQNVLFNTELSYQRKKANKRFAPIAALGLGYLLAFQQLGGTVNLANGQIHTEKETLHYFTPTLNLGFEVEPKKSIGYYFKLFYGRKFGAQRVDSSIFGVEFGMLLKMKKK